MNESSILIIGANGQLGRALHQHFPEAWAVYIDELDISDALAVNNFDWSGVKVILNAAAYTDVDGAETPEGRQQAQKVNVEAVANLAQVAAGHKLTIVHISTDYVFDGSKTPHLEDEPFSPLNVYGSTKAEGDKLISQVPNHYLLRTSWLTGDGKNFVRTMLKLGQKGVNPQVVNDQVGRLTFTSELVRAIDHLLILKPKYGTYNITNEGKPAAWAEVAQEIFTVAGLANFVTGITTSKYYKDKPRAAKRPLNSVLDLAKIKATGFEPRDWREDLKEYISKELKK